MLCIFSRNTTRKSWGEKLEKISSPKSNTRRWSLAPDTLTRNKKKNLPMEISETNRNEEDYVRVPMSEYEAFKTRLNSIETKINQEFNAAKLDAVKIEMGKKPNNIMNGVEKVESKFHETLKETEKLDDHKTDILAKRLSRELKIRPNIDRSGVTRSPSARKIGSLRRKRDSTTRLSRGNSWHISSTFDAPSTSATTITTESDVNTFYPKPNLKRLRLLDSTSSSGSTLTATPSYLITPIPQSAEKVIPEKPARKSIVTQITTTPSLMSTEVWTNATDFFKENKVAHEQEEVFKTPVRLNKLQVKGDIDINKNKTPMLPPRHTPAMRRLNTPMSDVKKTPHMNRTVLSLTPSGNESREARASIIQIRHQNAGQVAQKARLFDNLSSNESFLKSAERQVVKLPRVVINKKLESVKNMTNPPATPKHLQSPRRSSRSPGINRRQQLRVATSQSPALKTIKENKSENRVNVSGKLNLIKNSNVLEEIASPVRKYNSENRKILSQSNNVTPRRTPRTPNSSKKHRTPRNTPSSAKSPRRIARSREITFD